MDLTVIIPALNEENTICTVLDETLKIAKNIIVVNDGSTDRTPELIGRYVGAGVKRIDHPEALGKGTALRHALAHVTTRYVALQDADLEYPPENLLRLAEHADCSMVIGQRTMIMTDFYREVSMASFVANKIFANLSGVPDVFSGQRLLGTDFMRSLDLRAKGFEIETEITMKAIKRRAPIKFVPVGYRPRTREDGKKIGFVDFLRISSMYLRLQVRA